MALAAALLAARKNARESFGIAAPEVLLPAYGCPDLVSAVLYAGLRPILVDLAADTPWMDLHSLQSKLTPNTVAVIATHFLGIPERLAAIREALGDSNALIVEDSAQLFPGTPSDDVWQGDLVTLSFGRGKPVGLLGGGAVLCRNAALIKHLPLANKPSLAGGTKRPGLLYSLKVRLYNTLLSPKLYGVLQSVPFLNLGETVYTPLKQISPFDERRISILAANIEAYQERARTPQQWLAEMLADMGGEGLADLTKSKPNPSNLALLRYPVLLKDQQLRDKLLRELSQKGLGCSRMYPKPLPNIHGLENRLREQGEFPQASLFSQRLLTLPCHSGVQSADVKRIRQVILEVAMSG
jgi:dTDP-4-amino-4,6-dideoxygalactose transaminase